METEKALKISVTGAGEIPMEDLTFFQGDLKRLERTEYEKLRKNLLDNGFSFTIHVWKHEGKNYIIDGHQRVTALRLLAENEGLKVPALPVSYVEAATLEEAKLKILAGSSQYGLMTQDSLTDFMRENGISFDRLASSFELPQIDMAALSASLVGIQPASDFLNSFDETVKVEIRSSSEGVKQLQLYFTMSDYEELLAKTKDLAATMGLESASDVVLEVVRAHHKSTFN